MENFLTNKISEVINYKYVDMYVNSRTIISCYNSSNLIIVLFIEKPYFANTRKNIIKRFY